MIKITKMLLVIVVLFCTTMGAFADRGIGKKSKNRIDLNINTASGLKNSIHLNLRSGLKYTGSLLTKQQFSEHSMLTTNLATYQKGNTIYIVPYKRVFAIPDLKQGYTGMKLIIQPH